MPINNIKLIEREWNIISAFSSIFFMDTIQEVCPIGRSLIISTLERTLCTTWKIQGINEFRLKLKMVFLLWRRQRMIKGMILLSHHLLPYLSLLILIGQFFVCSAGTSKKGLIFSNSIGQRMQTHFTHNHELPFKYIFCDLFAMHL